MINASGMPWGTQLLEAGGVEFRLWAPDSKTVELLIESDARQPGHAMQRDAQGWWRLALGSVAAGTLYRYRIDGTLDVPDPVSRFQPGDVHGPSEVIDPAAYHWQETAWTGRPWHEAVVYELHVGAFTPQGTFRAAAEKLPTLAQLGVTAVELMPVADFPGRRNWGYDGVLLYAPDASYGRPEDLKAFIDSAHQLGLMVFLDVVYNHFGPDGNYFAAYAKTLFTERHATPWGAAINFDTGDDAAWVRRFFIDNALYWLTEYRFDGLRLDAIHAIVDESAVHVLTELVDAVRAGPGSERQVHLLLENDNNEAHWLRGGSKARYDAQWNDDFHHVLHAILTRENDSYYGDYADRPLQHLRRVLTEGFAYQGEASAHRAGAPRGADSTDLPPTAFINFLQNHDQVGNRAFGERLHTLTTPAALQATTAILLLSPMPPLLFMGQEWCASSPFPFFCDFDGELAAAVTAGRRREFARFPAFSDPAARQRIPDPVQLDTFEQARLNWPERLEGEHREWWQLHRDLLAIRQRIVTPLLGHLEYAGSHAELLGATGISVAWQFAGGTNYNLLANLGDHRLDMADWPAGHRVYQTPGIPPPDVTPFLPPWSVMYSLNQTQQQPDL